MIKSILRSIRTNILVGLALIAPIVFTFWVLSWMFHAATNQFLGLLPEDLHHSYWEMLFRLAALLLVFVLLFVIGLVVRHYLGRKLYHYGEKVLNRIPVFNKVYGFFRDTLNTLFAQRERLFREVVLIEYPRKGVYSLGFVTATVPPAVQGKVPLAQVDEEWLSVFIPTTPNPTSGWFCLVPRREVIVLPMSSGDGMKLVVSGGSVYPGSAQGDRQTSLLEKLNKWVDETDHPSEPASPDSPKPP